jgi:hypothetical protein
VADKKRKPDEQRGGYPSGSKPVTQLKPPPKGPGVGSRPSPSTAASA